VRAATVDEPVPDSPTGVLAEGAEALDVTIRQLSLGQLVRFSEDPGGGDWAGRALHDPSPYVRRRAVEALGSRLPEELSRIRLQEVVGRADIDAYTRGQAARLLASAEDHSTLPVVQEALASSQEDWERAPLAFAALVLGDDDALEGLDEALRRGDFPMEVDFFLDLGLSGRAELAEPLAAATERLEEDLLLPAAVSLIRLGHDRGSRLVREALGAEDPEIRLQALDFLADLEGDEATALIERARASGPPPVSSYAELVAFARGEGSPRLALEQAASIDREDRQQAVWAMGRHLLAAPETRHASDLRRALRRALGDVELVVVHEAIEALAVAGRPGDVPALEELLQQELLGVRVAVAAAILEIGSRG